MGTICSQPRKIIGSTDPYLEPSYSPKPLSPVYTLPRPKSSRRFYSDPTWERYPLFSETSDESSENSLRYDSD